MAFLQLRSPCGAVHSDARQNPCKNLWLQEHRADESLKAQKSWESSVCWNDRVIKIRGKQGER